MSFFYKPILPMVLALVVSGCSGWYSEPVAPVQQGPCPVVGTWQGIVPGGIMAGRVVTFVFNADGTATGTVSTIQVNSSYTRDGDSFQIVDISGTPAIAACPAHQVGYYTLNFNESCTEVEVVGSNDPCNHRRLTLTGLQARRR